MRKSTKIAAAGVVLVIAAASSVVFMDRMETTDRIRAVEPVIAEVAHQEPITPVPPPPSEDARKDALGERLFHDVRLSGQGDKSCASCHDLRTNGARVTGPSRQYSGVQGGFDTITIFNSALNSRLTWLGLFRSLEEQAEASLRNQQTMDADIQVVLARLNADSEIRREFMTVYGKPANLENLLDALATFERTLLTPGSKFDRWLLGERGALSGQELAGYKLFKTLGCISCHQGVNLGGNLYQKPGVFEPITSSAPAFVRVPSLRNVAVTAPYFHDGSAETLDEAIRRMARVQLNARVDPKEVEELKAFLEALTGSYRGLPLRSAE